MNEILNELHVTRRKILEDYQGDLAAFLRDAQSKIHCSDRPIWSGNQRKVLGERLQSYLPKDLEIAPTGAEPSNQ